MILIQRRWLLFTGIWFVWCSYHYCLPLLFPGTSMAQPGPGWDGYGTTAWIHAFLHPLPGQTHPWLGDFYQDLRIGMGHHAQPLISPFWRLWWSMLGLFSQDGHHLYTFNLLTLTLANALSCMWLCLQLRLQFPWHLVTTALVLGLEHFDLRAREHVGLVVVFPMFLAAGLLYRLSQRQRLQDWVWLGCTLTLGFWSSEYNTFFGGLWAGIFASLALLYRCAIQPSAWGVRLRQFLISGGVTLAGVLALLLLAYPRFLATPLLYRLGLSQTPPMRHLAWDRPRTDFEFYAITYVRGLIAPRLTWLQQWSPSWLLQEPWRQSQVAKETYEFTFGIGLLLPLLLVLCTVLLLWRMIRYQQQRQLVRHEVTTALWLGLASCALIPFALPSARWGSLVPLIAQTFPMMRVVQRSLLWWSIGTLLILGLLLQACWRLLQPKLQSTGQQVLAGLALAAFLGLAHADGRLKERPMWLPLATQPSAWSPSTVEVLQSLPPGKLLHLPLCHPQHDYASCDYQAMAMTAYHPHGLINGFDLVQHLPAAIQLSNLWQQPSAPGLMMMQALGIDYVILEPRGQQGTQAWQEILQPVADQVFRVPQPMPLSLEQTARSFAEPMIYPAALLGPPLASAQAFVPIATPEKTILARLSHGPGLLLQHPMQQLQAGYYDTRLLFQRPTMQEPLPELVLQIKALQQKNQWMNIPLQAQPIGEQDLWMAQARWHLPVRLAVAMEITSQQPITVVLHHMEIRPVASNPKDTTGTVAQ